MSRNVSKWDFNVTNSLFMFSYDFVMILRLITSSWVLEFELSTQLEKCQVKLKFFWKSVKSSWEVEFKHSSQVKKLDSTTRLENSIQLDKILDRCK